VIASEETVRAEIVAERERSQIVEAGAGTGKTTLLLERVLARLEDGVAISRLAVITFTRKAASELVARLRLRLTESARAGRTWAKSALAEFDLAVVGTTDAFCSSILADFALEAKVPLGFSVADEAAQSSLLGRAWELFLERSAEAETMLRRCRTARISEKSLRELAFELVSNRDLEVQGEPVVAFPPLLPQLASLLREALPLRDSCRDHADRLFLRIQEVVRLISAALAIGGELGERIVLARRRAGSLVTRHGRASAWGGPAEKGRVIETLSRIDRAALECARARGHELALEVSRWLRGYAREYASLKHELGLLDFRDLALVTRDLLRSHSSVRRNVAQRFDEILMDEVQDTDPLQMEIAFLLAAREIAAEDAFEAELVPGKLFLVGDPKQSIYRFRRADIELYERAKERMRSTGLVSSIRENYRSDSSIVTFVNTVFSGWMKPVEGARYQASYSELIPVRPAAAAGGVSFLLPDESAAPPPAFPSSVPRARARREREVEDVARLIRRALGVGGDPWQVYDMGAGSWRSAEASDLAVLVRKIEWGELLLETLHACGVPSELAGGKRFYVREEIETVATLLEAVVRPKERFARFAALRSPAFGFTDDELVRHFLDEGAASTGPLRSAEEKLERLAALARERSISEFLELLCEELGLLSVFGFRPDGRGRVEALRALVESADSLSCSGVDSLPEYLRWLRRQAGEGRPGTEELTPGNTRGVQILTMHKSKGLEFPIVVLADLAGEIRRGRRLICDRERSAIEFRLSEAALVETTGFRAASRDERLREDAEEVRLLYVAMTRARDHLVISWPKATGGLFSHEALFDGVGCRPGEAPPAGSRTRVIRAGELPALPAAGRFLSIDLEEP
jgi:ATP-dependent exoDNAse (exonuclease V) beta subunit